MHFASQLEQLLVSNNQMFLKPTEEGPQSVLFLTWSVWGVCRTNLALLPLPFGCRELARGGLGCGTRPRTEREQTLPVDTSLHCLISSPGKSLRDNMEGRRCYRRLQVGPLT